MPNHVPLPLVPISELTIERYYLPAHLGCPNTSIHPKRPLTIYRRPFTSTSPSTSHYTLPNPTSIESHLIHHDIVHPAWRYTMYQQDHFHSNTHEVLIVISPCDPDRAGLIRFGGPRVGGADEADKTIEPEETLSGREGETVPIYIQVRQGDVIIIPAGVSHALHSIVHDPSQNPHPTSDKQVDEIDADDQAFKMIGAYPTSSDPWDMCYPSSQPHPTRKSSRSRAYDDDEVRKGQRGNVERLDWFERDPIYGLKGLI
jgi:uncharacterized protein YjlB